MTLNDACKEIIRVQNANFGKPIDKFEVTEADYYALIEELRTQRHIQNPELVGVTNLPIRNFKLLNTPVVATLEPK